ncbi:choice-of-anchor D domain-containing protein [Winogradskyella sp. 3972H.M.0a.05]|uniref:choice-of-anchor D domain-containing protein n=1 Tax=Winogradskyella sp. 3972H.M.0a.05 TaxID=2950277 RepID=UPI003391FD45
MKTITLSFRTYALLTCILFTSVALTAQDFNVQHIQDDIGNSGGTNTSFTAVNMSNTVALANNNRKANAGRTDLNTNNLEGDDMSGGRQLTGTTTLSYYRDSGSRSQTMRFNTSLWEYTGSPGGANEMIVRGRYTISLNGGTNSVTQALTGVVNANDCIPFITGIINSANGDDADSSTAVAYLENATTLRVQKGSDGNNITVYVTVVEFTGSNWTVLHGDSGSSSADTGSITLRANSDGTGTATNVSDWSEAIIFTHHRGDMTTDGVDDGCADNWPITDPGANNQTVDWTFHSNHDGTNRHFVHVLNNTGLNVTRFQDTSNSNGETTINIASAGLSSLSEALIVGTTTANSTGAGYGRGWRNYYLNSTTQAAHWCHKNNGTLSHEIQIIDLSGLAIPTPEINITGLGNTINDGDTTPSVTDDTDFGNVDVAAGTNANTFTIQNLGSAVLNLTGSSPYVAISGANAADFTVTVIPAPSIAGSGNTTFDITFNPSAVGLRTATVSIANDDSDENPYTFDIQGTGFTPAPEINIQGNGTNITDGDTTPSVTDDTDFGSVDVAAGTNVNTFTIQNTGTLNLNLTAASPYVAISGAHAGDFTVTAIPAATIGASGSTTFDITFNPSALGLRTATVSIANNDSDENPYTFDIQGTGSTITYSQVTVEVYWPSWSSENRVEVYDPSNTLLSTIDNGYDGSANNSYATTVDLGCLQDLNNYYITMYDTYGDGWNGTGPYVIVRVNGVIVINNDGSSTTSAGVGVNVNFNVSGGAAGAEMQVTGNGTEITDGDTTPDPTDDTDFGSVNAAAGFNVNTFTINNTGCTASLNLTGSSPYVTITGAHAADFTLTANPSTPIASSSSTTFDITFNPSALGLRTASVSIANDDSDENPYTFDIQGMGIDICGGSTITSFPHSEDFETGLGDWYQETSSDDFDWTRQTGGTPSTQTGPAQADSGSYYLFTESNGNTNTTAILNSPCYNLTGLANPRFTFHFHMRGEASGTSYMGDLSIELSTDGGSTFTVIPWSHSGSLQSAGLSAWIAISLDLSPYIGQTIKLRFVGDVSNDNRSDMAIDNVSLFDAADPTIIPGDATTDLSLWLKANDGNHTDGDSVSVWEDQGFAADAKPHIAAQSPTYRDNATDNVNFNPVIEFDNTYATFSLDSDYRYDLNTTQFLEGDYGYYTEELFIVIIPDDTPVDNSFGFMDVICGDSNTSNNQTDTTGIGFGDYTGRISGEIISYAHSTYTQTEAGDGYAVAEIGTGSSYDNVGIINTRRNTGNTQQELYYNANDIETNQNDVAEFLNSDDTRYWIGRSKGWEATTNARIAEVISFKDRLTDTDLTQERNRIQSYLGIKYGITLGVNGTSQDYVDSDGTVIWDVDTGVPANDVFNYDIAGIGRDDDSDLLQKQSRSVNNATDGTGRTQGVLTMGISSIANTNNLNTNTSLTDKQFLIWGNDGVDLDDPAVVVDVDMSTDITPTISGGTWVQFNGIARTWKVVERGGDIPEVEVEILTNAVRTATPPDGRYLMFISDTPNFDPTADYRVMSATTNELGEATLTTNYDFDGTKYITFGWAPERVFERSIYFDPADTNYVDMEDALDLDNTGFTVSAWVMRDTNSANKSILSKRDASYTGGYDLKITTTGYAEMSWGASGSQSITSNVQIPLNQWHHIAVTYSSGTARMYIDGVLSNTASLSAPAATTHSFYIGAAAKNTPQAFFHGNIDEVRVWDAALTVDQLHYIMNQEIEANATFVSGKYFNDISVTPTKNDVSTLPWADLAGYYPMSTYTYTNTKDESGNGHQGALRNLRTVDRQTAPLPYQSAQDGQWDLNNTWVNGTLQTIPGTTSIVDSNVSVDWNIVRTTHSVVIDDDSDLPTANNGNRSVLALFVDSNTLTVDGTTNLATTTFDGTGLTVTHYLNLDGDIDLEGESQLIQSLDSDLAVTSAGSVERDQQGTADTYTYNYWSSPVGIMNTTTNNNGYTLPDVMRDGTNAITYATSGYDGSNTNPITIADYWIWKFANQPDDDYSAWQHVRSTGSMLAGEGFTMKGPGSGVVADEQNYVFLGKPNNGDINLTINANNDYLVGNPYASAIDANQFILDNGSVIGGTGATTGTLYFWEHWGGGNHNLGDYLGGYATYNLSGGVPSASLGVNDPDVGTGGTPRKRPGRYIAVSQGFFVVAEGSGGTINFNNGQRVFQRESAVLDGGASVFMRTAADPNVNTGGDDRMKFRIGLYSVNTLQRQVLLTIDENATVNVDWGYDAKLNESQMDDLYWMVEGEKYIIQGSNEAEDYSVYPIGIKTDMDGMNTISINELENVPSNITVYLHDKDNEMYYNLSEGDHEFYLDAGEYNDRFEITFSNPDSLSIGESELNTVDVYYVNDIESVVLRNPTGLDIKSIEMFNMLGQSIHTIENISGSGYSEYEVKNLSSGTYIIKLYTASGSVSKKVLVK